MDPNPDSSSGNAVVTETMKAAFSERKEMLETSMVQLDSHKNTLEKLRRLISKPTRHERHYALFNLNGKITPFFHLDTALRNTFRCTAQVLKKTGKRYSRTMQQSFKVSKKF